MAVGSLQCIKKLYNTKKSPYKFCNSVRRVIENS